MSSAQSLSDITDERVVPADYLGVLILLFLFMVLDRLFYTLGLHLGKVAVFIPCQVPSMPFCPGPLPCPALPCPSALPLCPAPLPCPVMSAPALLCLFSPALLPCFALPCPALSCLPGPTSACLSLHPSVNTTDITAYSVLQLLFKIRCLSHTHSQPGSGLKACIALQALLLWVQMALFYYYTFSLFWSPFSSSSARNQLRLLMLMKTASFALSALQLRSGYPPRASFR